MWFQIVVLKLFILKGSVYAFHQELSPSPGWTEYFGQGVISSFSFSSLGQNGLTQHCKMQTSHSHLFGQDFFFFTCLRNSKCNLGCLAPSMVVLIFYVGTNHHTMVFTCEACKIWLFQGFNRPLLRALYLLNCKWMMMMEDMLARFSQMASWSMLLKAFLVLL